MNVDFCDGKGGSKFKVQGSRQKQDKRQKSQDKSEIKEKDNPPSLPPLLAFHQSKKASVDEERKKSRG